MPNEAIISRIEILLDEVVSLGGASERTGIVSGLIVVDSAPSSAALANHIIVRDNRDGNFISVLKTPGQTYANNDLVSVLFIEGTEPIALAQSPGSSSDNVKVSEVWESDFGAVAGEADASGNFVWNNWQAADVNGFIVKNTSGAAAVAGDVGYLDDNNEYKTTTTAEDSRVRPVAVLQGAANNADIYVTKGSGRLTLNYTGTAPNTGEYLTFSATAGSVQARATPHYAMLALARANGSGGTVEAELLLLRPEDYLVLAKNLIDIELVDASDFVSVIAAAGVSGDKVYYGAVSSGNVNTLGSAPATDLARIVLHNTSTGGNSEALVIATGTDGTGDFIQVSAAADIAGWVATDAITARSQTNTTTIGGARFYDIEIVDSGVPELAAILTIIAGFRDTGATGERMFVHPFKSNNSAERQFVLSVDTSQTNDVPMFIPLIQKRFCLLWEASGAGTAFIRPKVRKVAVAG